MRVTVIGATGMVGTRVTEEAVHRGHRVTAVSRNPASYAHHAAVTTVSADAGDVAALRSILDGTDMVVLSVRPAPGEEATLAPTTTAVLDAAAATGARVFVVGGAGPLRSPDDRDLLLVDDTRYVPAQWRDIAVASVEQLRACERHADADWTCLSPPAVLEPGERTGAYRRGADTLLVADDGSSRISAEDLAVAVVDELENPSGQRWFTVAT